jgi:uncharacterized membrane protein
METLFAENRTLIVFLHVISAVIWVGGMIAIRFSAHYSLAQLEGNMRLARTAHMLKNLFMIVAPFVVILLATALIMAIAMGLHHGGLKSLAFAKEGIWTIMTLNFLVMVFRRNKAQNLINSGDFEGAKPLLGPISKIMVPVNIILGIVAIFLGAVFSS